MKSLQVYDKAMCCSTGVCGPQVDPVLPRFAADLDWFRSKGVSVERFNLAQQPADFVRNATVQRLLNANGIDCLPLIFVDGALMSQADYPSRALLCEWTGITPPAAALPVLGGCSSESDCC